MRTRSGLVLLTALTALLSGCNNTNKPVALTNSPQPAATSAASGTPTGTPATKPSGKPTLTKPSYLPKPTPPAPDKAKVVHVAAYDALFALMAAEAQVHGGNGSFTKDLNVLISKGGWHKPSDPNLVYKVWAFDNTKGLVCMSVEDRKTGKIMVYRPDGQFAEAKPGDCRTGF